MRLSASAALTSFLKSGKKPPLSFFFSAPPLPPPPPPKEPARPEEASIAAATTPPSRTFLPVPAVPTASESSKEGEPLPLPLPLPLPPPPLLRRSLGSAIEIGSVTTAGEEPPELALAPSRSAEGDPSHEREASPPPPEEEEEEGEGGGESSDAACHREPLKRSNAAILPECFEGSSAT